MNLAWDLRNWLLQIPKPTKVRVTDANGDVKELEIGRRPMVRIGETLAALGPELVEALGPEDKLLRAYRPNCDDEQVSRAPAIPQILSTDPNAAMLSLFAQLIHRSYEHSTELAFNKLVELFERMNERSEGIERRLERAEAAYRREQSERIDDLWEQASEVAAAGGSKDQILQTLLSSMMQGAQHRQQAQAAQAAQVAQDKSNGGKQ